MCTRVDARGVLLYDGGYTEVECHPGWQQGKLWELCRSKGVHLSAHSPLGSRGTKSVRILAHPILVEISKALGRSPAQVALCWGVQLGHSVLPKSVREARIKENIDTRLCTGSILVHPESVYKSLEELWDGKI
ncbi:hypothetical protein HPP92_019846 [Vanilla planifolia]|uniref:NADP-dependent oxidoreductase domain-containing protein n=1 Tax=Vanilla planifolia TaxID=51239 RepID=A0A835UJB0_VANPL|nr:hypothetical protein HPP92_019846 [Vanilla planifolia]